MASPAAAADPPRWAALSGVTFQPLEAAGRVPNSAAVAAVQDGEGFLWIGTTDGLARWDGYRLHTFRPDAANRFSLPDNLIQTLFTDFQGRLWIGTATGGLASYDSVTDRFRTFGIASRPNGRIEIRAICDDGAGGLWVGGAHGLYRLPAGAPAMLPVDPPHPGPVAPQAGGSDSSATADDRVLSILRDRQGTLWVGRARGLFRKGPAEPGFTEVRLTGKPNAVVALGQDQAGRIWAGTGGFGAFVLAADGSRIHPVGGQADDAQASVQTMDIETITEVRPGEMWLGTAGNGIVVVDEATLATRHIRHDPSRPTSLADDTVWSLYRDPKGLVWAATARGIARTDPAGDGILTLFGLPGQRDGISDPNVNAVLAAPDGRIWLGLSHGGLNIIDPSAQHIASLPPGPDFPDAIVDALAASQAAPGPPGVFVGTWRGLYRADAAGRDIAAIRMPGDTPFVAVTALAERNGALWIGRNLGLDRLDPAPGATVQTVLGRDKLPDPRVPALLPDDAGTVWIGGWDGLSRFDPARNAVRAFRSDPADTTTIAQGATTCLLIDRQHRLWVGTAGGGLTILTRGAIRRLGTADGLPNPNIDKLLEARDGTIWASTDDGLARIDPISLRITTFHESDGVVLQNYWANAGAVTAEGELLFGATGGLTVVRPDRLAVPADHPRLVITDLQSGGRTIPAGQYNSPGAPRLAIQPEADSLSVEFSALDFADPGRRRYQYRLTNFDHDWINTDASRRLAAYDNLPPGDYTLQVRVSDAAGSWFSSGLSLPIRVLPAWYQTMWCRGAAALLTAAALLLVVRLQTMRLRHRQVQLQQLVAQRTAELRQSNTALTHAAAVLSDLGVIGQQITASLDIDTVFAVMHDHVARLLDAPLCAIYLIQRPAQTPVLRFAMQNGLRLEQSSAEIAVHDALVQNAIRERREIFAPHAHPAEPGLICAPLTVHDRVIGAMLIQSPSAHAFAEREWLIFRSLCAYGAIALANAETLVALATLRVQLEHLAYTDGLTNLPNRRVYVDQFDQFAARSRASAQSFALLLIDIDRFKDINDGFGHDAGDAVLAEAARRLRLAVRDTDIVIRLGGDEFAILLGSVGTGATVEQACTRISEQFLAGLTFQGAMIEASVSIGAARFPADGDTQEHLYKAADLALYEAKRAGRNTWRSFNAAQPGAGRSQQPVQAQ